MSHQSGANAGEPVELDGISRRSIPYVRFREMVRTKNAHIHAAVEEKDSLAAEVDALKAHVRELEAQLVDALKTRVAELEAQLDTR